MLQINIARTFVICCLFLPLAHAQIVSSPYYGTNPLSPDSNSIVGQYLAETHATSVVKSFPMVYGGTVSTQRLVVTVSENTFPQFEQHFKYRNILFLYHDPYARYLEAAFQDNVGAMARLNRTLQFSASGTMLFPIVLSDSERQRVEEYFALANEVRRDHDVALFPWLLTGRNGIPYSSPGNSESLSEWFPRLPIGDEFDLQETTNTYSMSQYSSSVQQLLSRVWTVPHARQSLAQVLGLRVFRDGRALDTPALIASSMLANMTSTRMPVVFRFVNDHRVAIPADFNLWFDLDFNPNLNPTLWKEYLDGTLELR
jgi:hypothetical protein